MALNPYFTQGTGGEQGLVQDLINEQLRMYGVDVHYIPRKYLTKNTIIKEVIQSKFDDAYPIEAYVKSDAYEGSGILLSKFGVQAQEDITLVISKERWETYIQPLMKNESNVELVTRPKEGDLVYFPLDDRLYEIKFVERADPFYQLQKLYTYELRCEVFRYEDEVIDTGIDEIDDSTKDAGYSETLTLVGIGSTATASATFVNGGIQFISITNQGQGYTYTPTVAISSSPGITATAVAITTSTTGFSTASSIREVLLTNPGAGYSTTPTVTFSSPGTGITALGEAIVSSAGTITAIRISNAGYGYTVSPTITISDPSLIGSGDFIFNEIVTGGNSGTQARVKEWDASNNTLRVSIASGTFTYGETITGSESGSSYILKVTNTDDLLDTFADNDNIQREADAIIDWTQRNPFGEA